MGLGETSAFPKQFLHNNERIFEPNHFKEVFPGITDVVAGYDNEIARARASPLNANVRKASDSTFTSETPPDISIVVSGTPEKAVLVAVSLVPG